MKGRFPNIELYKFPRMSPIDTEIWRRWFVKYGKTYKRYDYDLAVGSGEDPGEKFSPELRKDFIDLTKKRIDAVGYKNNTVTIFEVKPRAGTTAYGQLLTYSQLFIQSNPSVFAVNLAVVSEFISTEEKQIYEAANIQIFIV